MRDVTKDIKIEEWGVFTSVTGEKYLATCPRATSSDLAERNKWWEEVDSGWLVELLDVLSFRMDLVTQPSGVVRVPVVGGVDMLMSPAPHMSVRLASVFLLEWLEDSQEVAQYTALVRHALRQMTAARAQQSGLVLP